jgi:hypothetical protein
MQRQVDAQRVAALHARRAEGTLDAAGKDELRALLAAKSQATSGS